jgi:5-methyltetrahydrofolate--homocysteine methyltransferase
MDLGYKFCAPRNLMQEWMDPEFRLNQFLYNCSNTFYGGEAFPCFWVNFGPGVITSFVGTPYILAEGTVWFGKDHIVKDWSSKPDIKFNPDNEMWKAVRDTTDYLSKNAKDKYFVGMTDIGGSLDILATLRGTEDLLYDLYDFPDEVKNLTNTMDEIWFSCFDKLHSSINRYMDGSASYMELWHPGRWYPLQCDFSAMISPLQFEEFVKPTLIKQTEFLDNTIYHLDGMQALPHLDHLLDIERLTGIQWEPGVGNTWASDEMWFPMYKKIQAKGKNLIIYAEPKEIEKLLENISPKGVYINTYCETEDEAKELIKNVEKWSLKSKG